jgi:membrane fusion protein (multidrug efflux system)
MADKSTTALRATPPAPGTPPQPARLDPGSRGPRSRRKTVRAALLIGGPLLVLLASAWFYVTGGRYYSTDDAFVKTDLVSINAQVDGQVARVAIRDNQRVRAGELLFEIDPRTYQIALAQAEANLAQARDQVAGLRATYQSKQAELKQAQNTIAFLEREYKRQNDLAGKGYASQQKFDEASHNLAQAQQQKAVIQQQLAEIQAQLGGSITTPTEQTSLYEEALAKRNDAALALQRTKVYAPADGVLANVTLRPGSYVKAGDPIFALAETAHTWVIANFKETQLTYVRPGQAATITVDAYPAYEWTGTVESLSPASGNEFSLLPAQRTARTWC